MVKELRQHDLPLNHSYFYVGDMYQISHPVWNRTYWQIFNKINNTVNINLIFNMDKVI